MSHKYLTAICILVDGSGSMESIKKGVVSGFNEFIKSQKLVKGDAVLSMHQFSSNYYGGIPNYYGRTSKRYTHEGYNEHLDYRTIYNFVDLKEVKDLTLESYVPNGNTPLLDAMSRAIDEFGESLARIPEKDRPSKVVFVTITDGEENSSTCTSKEQLLSKITHQSDKYDWNFVYLGANQDSFAEAGQYGISMKSTSNYRFSNTGVIRAMCATSDSLTNYRTGVTNKVDLTDFQKELEGKTVTSTTTSAK